MEQIVEPEKIFVDINPDNPVTEVESFCVNCHKNGITRILLTKIPFFKEIYTFYHSFRINLHLNYRRKVCLSIKLIIFYNKIYSSIDRVFHYNPWEKIQTSHISNLL
jgi:hypothetical protein